MTKKKQLLAENIPVGLQTPTFGYEILREVVIPELLGKEAASILYWVGKNIARHYPLATTDAIIDFFEKAGWGKLATLEQKKKNEAAFELTGDLITYRAKNKIEFSYQMEAGFLAQQFQQQLKCIAESHEEQKHRGEKIIITVQWDPKDEIDG